jgi:hypothetical protein
MKKKLYILLTLILFSISSNIKAQDISAANNVGDTIYYNITSNVAPYTVEVTYKGSSHMTYPNEYMGAIQIPSTVTNNGITYSVTSIGEYAFGLCSALTSVNIPNSITSINAAAFFECEALTSINLHNFITSIGDFAFFGCVQLTSVNIPNTLISISNGVFKNTGLTSVIIPNSVRQIGAGAFWNCSGLISVNITDSLTSIGSNAFSGCSSLSSSILLPNSLTKIENNTFENCSNLTSVVIGKNITSIGVYAFRNCSNLNSIIFPYNLDSIGYRAFINCIGLTSITFKEVTPPTFNQFDIFNNVPNTTQINVPCGSKALYQSRLWNRNIQDSIDCNFLSVNVSNISATHARININTSTTDITRIGFQWKVNGDSLFNTYIDSSANLQYTITGLSASTEYNYRIFYIINNETYYTIIDTFLTHCNSISLPYYEDFETPLSCWLNFKTTNYSLMVVSSGVDPNCSPYSGVNMVKYDSWYVQAGNYAGYITPPINLLTNSQLSIWIYRYNGNYSNNNEGLRFYVNSENTLNGANELGFISNNRLAPPTINTNGWYNYTLTIPSSEIGEKYIIIKAESQNGYNIYFDDLRIYSTSVTTNINASICHGETYSLNGFNVNSAGTYTQNLNTINGGDSIVTLNLTIYPTIDTTHFTASICQGESYLLNGFNANIAGNYIQNLQSINGCDSIVTLNLSFYPIIDTTNFTASICQGESYLLNGFNVNSAGTYIQNLQTINGCDSVVTLNLSVNELMTPTNLALDNISNYIELMWRGNGDRYIVYRNNDSIANITDTIYQDTNVINGTNYCYKIKALNNSCESELSQEVCQVFSGLNYIGNNDLYVTLYPNPTNDKATLEVEGLTKEADVIVYDINGRKVKQYNLNAGQKKLEIDVKGFAKGVYNVKIVNDNISLTRKLIVR